MELQQGIFAVKLCELEGEYGRLQSRIWACQEKDSNQMRALLEEIRSECEEQDLLMEQRIKGSCMKSVSELAKANLDYRHRIEDLLHAVLEQEMRGKNATETEDRAEASTLFAEFAIDFATQSMRYALRASIQALELYASVAGESRQAQNGTEDQHE